MGLLPDVSREGKVNLWVCAVATFGVIMEATFQQVYNECHDGTLPKAIEHLYVEPQNAR